MRQVLRALGLVIAVCIGVRLGAWIVKPLLPDLLILGIIAIAINAMLGGPHFRS